MAERLVKATSDAAPVSFTAGWNDLDRTFPTAEQVAEAPDEALSMPTARRDAIRRAAAAIVEGDVILDAGVDPERAREQLIAVKGIGPWTADYVLMRGLGHPDVMLGTDLGVVHALRRCGCDGLPPSAGDWSPWRSYAVHHLWASLDADAALTEPTQHSPNRSRT